MLISDLKINNYRNLKNNKFTFSNEVNYIYGENAQGKTNLLESIWMLTGTRSFRGTRDIDLINFNENYAKLEANLFFENREQNIKINFAESKRKIFLNDISQNYPTDIIGKFRAVLFIPGHISLIKDKPESRRKFIDAAICQLKPSYTKTIVTYNRILKQRNALLKDISRNSIGLDVLEIWNLKLAKTGAQIISERIKYLEQLEYDASKIHSEVSNSKEYLKSVYCTTLKEKSLKNESEDKIEAYIISRLEETTYSDIKRGFTSVGPHKDDIELFLQDKSLKAFGSQGQQRSAILSLKLAEASVLERNIGESPVILLDDVMSELDEYRKSYVISKIKNRQTFITGCDKDLIKNFSNINVLNIKNGDLLS